VEFLIRFFGVSAVSLALVLAPQTAAADNPTQENWATQRARALTEQGRAHRKSGDSARAITRFNEALAIDATFGDAYIELAALREASGELDEADRVLAVGLERIPGFVEGLAARGQLYGRAKRYNEATTVFLELAAMKPDDEPTLRKVLQNAMRARQLPVALAAARRLASLAARRDDPVAVKDARLTVKALARLLGEVDPVVQGKRSGDRVRRALAAVELR
jgi:tetratricopeptide (TPR) repeat protein